MSLYARSSGALITLAAGFLLSAALRAGDVVAALPGASGDGFGNPLPRAAGGAGRSGAIEPDGTGTAPADRAPVDDRSEALSLIADLRARRDALDARAATLETRAQTLEALEARVGQRLDQLEEAQRRLERTAVMVDDAAGRDVRHLAEMYTQMKPKQAAEIFDEMPPSFAAGFLSRLAPEAAALIMANMEPDRAYAVSILLAGRNVGRTAPGLSPGQGR